MGIYLYTRNFKSILLHSEIHFMHIPNDIFKFKVSVKNNASYCFMNRQ